MLSLYALGPGELGAFSAHAAKLTDNRPLLGMDGFRQVVRLAGTGEVDGRDTWSHALQRLRGGDLPTLIAYDRDPRRDARFQYALALGYERLRDGRSAGMALDEALRLDPHFEPARKELPRMLY